MLVLLALCAISYRKVVRTRLRFRAPLDRPEPAHANQRAAGINRAPVDLEDPLGRRVRGIDARFGGQDGRVGTAWLYAEIHGDLCKPGFFESLVALAGPRTGSGARRRRGEAAEHKLTIRHLGEFPEPGAHGG